MTKPRSFAVVPAAGHSRRMGTAKLLLNWRGQPLIDHLLSAWRQSQVGRVIVVVRQDDRRLQNHLASLDVDVVVPSPAPLEMKDSVAAALRHIHQQYAPQPFDTWLLAPADLPHLETRLVDRLLAARPTSARSIVVPSCNGKRGHPVRFPWAMHQAVWQLGPNQGVNALLEKFPVDEFPVDAVSWQDVDCPDDYRRLSDERPDPTDSH